MEKRSSIIIVGNLDFIYIQVEPLFPKCEFVCMSYSQLYSQLCEKDIHTLLLDWKEEEEGLYRVSLLKRLKPKLNIILINSCLYPIRRAMFRGAFAVVDPPFDIEDIQELIGVLIDEHK